MPGKLLDEFVIPARHGRGFVVKKGQVFRIAQVEGGQVGDCAFYNADDPKETFHCGQSWAINVTAGTVLRFLPPYIITRKEIARFVKALDKIFSKVPAGQ